MLSSTKRFIEKNSGEYTLDDAQKLWKGLATTLNAAPNLSLKMGVLAPKKDWRDFSKVKRRRIVDHGKDLTGADYELLRPLGEGGMGLVFRARQLDVERNVALKLLKREAAEELENREKFLAEAIVTANLDHPNIIPLYDLGYTEKEEFFYTMRELRGDDWSLSLPNFSEQENLEILLKVCDAIAYAHSHGVLHRDLKPENIMLGNFGEVVVTDWGLAASAGHGLGEEKAVDLGPGTLAAGTACYMAPEMARGDHQRIGPASDIYLLGGILYQIATGLKPHGGENVMQCLHQALNNLIQQTDRNGELIDIARKALATAPEDRYPVVKSFQAAIQGYLKHGESLALTSRARRDLAEAEQSGDYELFNRARFSCEEALKMWPMNQEAAALLADTSLAYAKAARSKSDFDLALGLLNPKLSEQRELREIIEKERSDFFRRRNHVRKLRRLAGAMGALLLIVSLAAAVWISSERGEAVKQRGEAVKQRGEAVKQRDKAVLALERAEKQEKIAREQSAKALERARQVERINKFISDMLSKANPMKKGDRNVTVLEVMDQMSAGVAKEFSEDLDSSGKIQSIIGKVYCDLGYNEKAEPHLENAVRIVEALGEEHPDYINSLNNLGQLRILQNDYAKAEELGIKVSKKIKRKYGENSYLFAASQNNLAHIYLKMKKYEQAQKLFSKAILPTKRTYGEKHPLYAALIHNFAMSLCMKGEYNQAEPYFIEALKLRKQIFGEKHPLYAETLRSLAKSLVSQGNFAKAKPLYSQELKIKKEAFGKNNPKYLDRLMFIAKQHTNAKNWREAERLYLEGIEIASKEAVDNKTFILAGFLLAMANSHFDQGRLAEAERSYLKATETIRDTEGINKNKIYIRILDSLANLRIRQGRLAEAEISYLEAVEIIKNNARSTKSEQFATLLLNLAKLHSKQGKMAEAESEYLEAIDIVKNTVDRKKTFLFAEILINMATLRFQQCKFTQAERGYLEVATIYKDLLGKRAEKNRKYILSLNNLAWTYLKLDKLDEAEKLFSQVMDIQKREFGKISPISKQGLNSVRYKLKLRRNKVSTESQ